MNDRRTELNPRLESRRRVSHRRRPVDSSTRPSATACSRLRCARRPRRAAPRRASMSNLGIRTANIGFAAASATVFRTIVALGARSAITS